MRREISYAIKNIHGIRWVWVTTAEELHKKTTNSLLTRARWCLTFPVFSGSFGFHWTWVFVRPPLDRANHPNDDYTTFPGCGAIDKARRINTPNLKSSCFVCPRHPRPLASSRHSRATSKKKKKPNSSAFQERHSSQQGTKKLTDVRICFAKVLKITHLCGFTSGPLYFLPFFSRKFSRGSLLLPVLLYWIIAVSHSDPLHEKRQEMKIAPQAKKTLTHFTLNQPQQQQQGLSQ